MTAQNCGELIHVGGQCVSLDIWKMIVQVLFRGEGIRGAGGELGGRGCRRLRGGGGVTGQSSCSIV